MKKILALFVFSSSSLSHAQWIPNLDRNYLVKYEPLCSSDRKQVRVRLLDSTNFFFGNDVQVGTVLYAIRFTARAYQKESNPPTVGVAYCEPYSPKEVGFFTSHRERSRELRAKEKGFAQCLFDFDEDMVFDEATGSDFYLKKKQEISRDHQYRYEKIEVEGPPELGCPRPAVSAGGLRISESIWAALTSAEREILQNQTIIDVIPAKEFGIVMSSQKINRSIDGSNAGSVLGEAAAAANYIDKTVSNGTYSAKGQLGAQVAGAVVGGLLNTAPKIKFQTRYTLRNGLNEVVAIDKSSNVDDFDIANGVCVAIPSLEKMDQFLCEATVQNFRSRHLGEAPSSLMQPRPKEARLRELKDLFNQGLISEKVYQEQQKTILSE